jgi:hypothetical protein
MAQAFSGICHMTGIPPGRRSSFMRESPTW